MIPWLNVNKALPIDQNQYCVILIGTMRGIFTGWYNPDTGTWSTTLKSYSNTKKVKYFCPVKYPDNFESVKE